MKLLAAFQSGDFVGVFDNQTTAENNCTILNGNRPLAWFIVPSENGDVYFGRNGFDAHFAFRIEPYELNDNYRYYTYLEPPKL